MKIEIDDLEFRQGDRIIIQRITSGNIQVLGARGQTIAFKTIPGDETLSKTEYNIAGLVARGLSNKEIAAQSGKAESTVKTHIHHILGKLRLKNRTELIYHYALKREKNGKP